MRVLSVALSLVFIRRFGNIILAVFFLYKVVSLRARLVGYTLAVGTHIGYKTHGAHILYLKTFVKLLRDFHRAPCLKRESARSLLL